MTKREFIDKMVEFGRKLNGENDKVMIFQNLPNYIYYYKDLKMIGYWWSKEEPHFPLPKHFITHSWNAKERSLVINYLKQAEFYEGWMGESDCRICHSSNGATDLSDGTYVFPEGFVHYIEAHGVKPDQEFIDYVIAKNVTQKPTPPVSDQELKGRD